MAHEPNDMKMLDDGEREVLKEGRVAAVPKDHLKRFKVVQGDWSWGIITPVTPHNEVCSAKRLALRKHRYPDGNIEIHMQG